MHVGILLKEWRDGAGQQGGDFHGQGMTELEENPLKGPIASISNMAQDHRDLSLAALPSLAKHVLKKRNIRGLRGRKRPELAQLD